jgi:uncharacterized repeat protein (TIGR01451 family)
MRERRSYLRWTALLGAVSIISIVGLLAVHFDGLFELGDEFGTPQSADISGSALQDGCDWADLFDADPTDAEIAAAVAACDGIDAAFVADQISQGKAKEETVFAKGSSKNNDPIENWQWLTGSSPGKNDLTNFYTYATLNDSNELVIYAGVERRVARGDSHIDFEFNQSLIGLDKLPPCENDLTGGAEDGPPCEFTGEKTLDDILVVMDFEKGGDLGSLEIRRWDGSEYVLQDAVGGESCNAADTVCAINNGGSIDGGPWDNFDSKGNIVTTLDRNAFTEAGFNVTALLGHTPCFVTVQAKSRSSQSFTSTLKDFAQASFETCGIELTTSGYGPSPDIPYSKGGDDVTFSFTIENTGGAELFLNFVEFAIEDWAFIKANLVRDLTAEARAADCDPLGPGETCNFNIVESIAEDADDPIVTNTFASYSTFSTSGKQQVTAVEDGDDLSVNLFQPSVLVEKSGDTLSMAGNVVNYSIEITNNGSPDSPDLVPVYIEDSLLGDLLEPANPASPCSDPLPVGSSCTILASYTVPVDPSEPDTLVNTVDVLYNPAGGFPNEIVDSDSHGITLVYPSAALSVVGAPSAAFVGDTITYTFLLQNSGDVALTLISALDTLLGNLEAFFPTNLDPGSAASVVVLSREIQIGDPDPVVNEVTVVYQVAGLENQLSISAAFSVDILVPCALSPGFWKGGEGSAKWGDLTTDYIAQLAGFDTNTIFPSLDPSLAGASYLEILELPAHGDITRQLSFKFIAARLNQAVFGVTTETAFLLESVASYLAANPVGSGPSGEAGTEGEALMSAVNAYFATVGEGLCPSPDSF